MRLIKLLVLLLLCYLPRICIAQGEDASTPETEQTAPVVVPPTSMELQAQPSQTPPPIEDYGSAFFKMLSALVVLLLVVVLVVWLFKSISRGKFSRGSSSHIEIIERRALSQKSMLYLIEVDGARVLLAESQVEVRPLYQESASRIKAD